MSNRRYRAVGPGSGGVDRLNPPLPQGDCAKLNPLYVILQRLVILIADLVSVTRLQIFDTEGKPNHAKDQKKLDHQRGARGLARGHCDGGPCVHRDQQRQSLVFRTKSGHGSRKQDNREARL